MKVMGVMLISVLKANMPRINKKSLRKFVLGKIVDAKIRIC